MRGGDAALLPDQNAVASIRYCPRQVKRVSTTQEFLLDTGVFHSISFAECERLQSGQGTFSAGLSVPFELITGFEIEGSDANLMSRHAAIRRYQQMIQISPGLIPEGVVEKSFGLPPTQGGARLMELCVKIEEIDTPERLRRFLSNSSFFHKLKAGADRVSDLFVEAVKTAVTNYKTATKEGLAEFDLPRDHASFKNYVQHLNQFGDLTRCALIALAERAGRDTSLPATGLYEASLQLETELRSHYDGSLDVYIDAYVDFFVSKMDEGGSAHRNDSFDLDRLMYLRSADQAQKFVSTDKALVLRVNRVREGRATELQAILKQ